MNTDLSLKYLEFPSTQKSETPLLILLHGRGANEDDLADLAPTLTSGFKVIVPRAPIQMGLRAFGWINSVRDGDHYSYNADELIRTRDTLLQFIREVKHKYSVTRSQVFLFGFSQGAMMSFGIGLSHPQDIGGIACLNGRILTEFLPSTEAKKVLKDFPVFLSHGIQDEIVFLKQAHLAKVALDQLGVNLTYKEYPMGHDITDVNFPDARDWLLQMATIAKS